MKLKRFESHQGNFIKGIRKVQCTETLSLPFVVDDVSFHKRFNLKAIVKHTGSLDKRP